MTDGDRDPGTSAYTVRLELVDEPGELLRALEPIADGGGNLLSVYHERGDRTPRGRVPVEIDLECAPERFNPIVESIREAGVSVIRAGAEAYEERATVLLVGHLVETDLSDTLERVEDCPTASVADLTLSAPEGREDVSSARIRMAVEAGGAGQALATVREVAEEKDLRLVEPLIAEGDR